MNVSKVMASVSFAELWGSPRLWATLSTMSNRGVGFIVSLSISRLLDTQSLALYISTVIAASTVVAPLVQMLFNAGTVGGASAAPRKWLRAFLAYEKRVVCLATPLLMLLLGAMQWSIAAPLSREVGVSTWWLVLVGFSAIGSQLFVGAMSGLLNGMNCQLSTYRLQAFVSMATILLSFPAVWIGGMTGAWLVLIGNSWMPVLLLFVMVRRNLGSTDGEPGGRQVERGLDLPDPRAEALRQIRLCLPNVIGLAASGVAVWFCTIKLVSVHHGASGVATVAVANQWLTLILVPVSSWAGVQLRELVGLRLQSSSRYALRCLMKRLLMRNLLTTGALAAGLLVAAPILEVVYRMQGKGLADLLGISALVALMFTIYGVLESALIAWERQWLLMRMMFVGLAMQTLVTLLFIDHSVMVAQLGTLVAWLTMATIGVWVVRKHMTEVAS
jgi:hypothetical protein